MGSRRKAKRPVRHDRRKHPKPTEHGWLVVSQLRFAIEEAGLSGRQIELEALVAEGDNPVASALAQLGLSPTEATILLALSEDFVSVEIQERMVRAGRTADALDLGHEGSKHLVRAAMVSREEQ